ncbi:hypothetical protein [Leptospira weilii]|uniref:hypothetical protein n=1 Tax=Leptospira weilii TaxID=28184 RepID=UPI00056BC7EC|nr:hypothetical protein [Leptospira weilii]
MKNRILFIILFFVLQGCLTVTEKEIPSKIELEKNLIRLEETLVILEEYRVDLNPELVDRENISQTGNDHLKNLRDPRMNRLIKSKFATALAQCRCFQNIVVAVRGIEDVESLRNKYRNVIRVKLEDYYDSKAVLPKVLLTTFTFGLIPTWYSFARKVEFIVESPELKQPAIFKYERRFTLYAHFFLIFGLFNAKSVFSNYAEFSDFFQLLASEIYSQKLIPLDI